MYEGTSPTTRKCVGVACLPGFLCSKRHAYQNKKRQVSDQNFSVDYHSHTVEPTYAHGPR